MANLLLVSIEAFRAHLAQFIGRVVCGKERIVARCYGRDAVVYGEAAAWRDSIRNDV